jgi:hypothetical protein
MEILLRGRTSTLLGSVKAVARTGQVTTVCKTNCELRPRGQRAARAEDARHYRSNSENPKTVHMLPNMITAHGIPAIMNRYTGQGCVFCRQASGSAIVDCRVRRILWPSPSSFVECKTKLATDIFPCSLRLFRRNTRERSKAGTLCLNRIELVKTSKTI